MKSFRNFFLGTVTGVIILGLFISFVFDGLKSLPKIIAKLNESNIAINNNIMYQTSLSKEKFSWNEAKTHCLTMKLKGYDNWRLPTKKELSSILGNISIDKKEINLWTEKKGSDSLVWAIEVDTLNWYRSETIQTWKNPSLCVREIK